MASYEVDMDLNRYRIEEDKEILREVRSDKALLEEIRYRILSKKLHNQIMALAKDAVDNEIIPINNIEDFCTLARLDLSLLK